jgi:peptidoglycan hydrolase-like protein with peptidoglycan-binding domain
MPLTQRLRPRARSHEADGSNDGALESAGPRRRGRTRTRALALVVIVLAGGVVAAVLLLGGGSSPRNTAAGGVPAGDTTATVERRTLVERAAVDGTLSYGGALEMYDRLAGTFTWLPSVGAVISRGGVLFRLDDLPVLLMYGKVPAYRALAEGVSDGPDVNELNTNLIDLGFDPYGAIGDRNQFSAATADAVRRFQEADGLPQTGQIELGRVLFAPGARRITAVHVTLGEDPPGKSKPKSTPKPKPKPKEKEKEKAKEEPAKPEGAAAPQLALGTTSTQQLVQLQVKATQQQLAHVREAVPVTLPSGQTVNGHITSVGTVASEPESEKEKGAPGGGGSGNGENAVVDVTVTLDHPVAHLDKAPVNVELVKEIRRHVLAVPATALLATAGGGYAIQALVAGHREDVPVTPGMFANGYVQVEGAGVQEGLTVLQPQ